jgi:hypothetical protein
MENGKKKKRTLLSFIQMEFENLGKDKKQRNHRRGRSRTMITLGYAAP